MSASEIAIIGMAARVPGAVDLKEFWRNLRAGVEAIAHFSRSELDPLVRSTGVDRSSNYVRARGILQDIDLWSAEFFGCTPREAMLMDPQHRLFLELAWVALESAGYPPGTHSGLTAVFGSVGLNTYWPGYVAASETGELTPPLAIVMANAGDFLSNRVSYKFGLTGPSVCVQSACSSSLVAVHMACQSLRSGECDMALAGGVSIAIPERQGYLHEEGGVGSPDGRCRAFDRKASGSVGGNGAGVVLLKRLVDAIADGDCIRAVIKGSATNNDGRSRAGYTAPGVDGQVAVIRTALNMAGVGPERITYIEAHGTGTPLGDAIEVTALQEVFSAKTENSPFCGIGSVKSNIGHLDIAAGIVGLIKTVLSLEHRSIPPTLHVEQPSPQLNPRGPFYLPSKLLYWNSHGPRCAGVSSFGLGGTNAHVVLEEAPPLNSWPSQRALHLLVLSAKTPTALIAAETRLACHLREESQLGLADVAYTLQVGRKAFDYRRSVVCSSMEDATGKLECGSEKQSGNEKAGLPCSVVFMFPGQGSQAPGMGFELYNSEPVFREHFSRCAEILRPMLNLDLRELLFAADEVKGAALLRETQYAQPALFALEYSLAQWWIHCGIFPAAMIGHSLGEYVASCLAGVFCLKDGLHLIANRARLMQRAPVGGMLAVAIGEVAIRKRLLPGLELAAVNGSSLTTVSGPLEQIGALENTLRADGVSCERLRTSHAFHSSMMDSVLDEFLSQWNPIQLHRPSVPFISNLTGTWMAGDDAVSPDYWVQHLRQTVRFADGLHTLQQQANAPQVLLEVGPGVTLSTLARSAGFDKRFLITCLPRPSKKTEQELMLHALGRLWELGTTVDWDAFQSGERRRRVALPAYPFERQRYWLDPKNEQASPKRLPAEGEVQRPAHEWFYVENWKHSAPTTSRRSLSEPGSWLIFVDECGVGADLAQRLRNSGHMVTTVCHGSHFHREQSDCYEISPGRRDDYAVLLAALAAHPIRPDHIVHLWALTRPQVHPTCSEDEFRRDQDASFYSALYLIQELARQGYHHSITMTIVSAGLHDITGDEDLCFTKATLLGPCRVIPQEYPNIRCRNVDLADIAALPPSLIADKVLDELLENGETVVALRGRYRWVQRFDRISLLRESDSPLRLHSSGTYLITGGLGRIGRKVAKSFVERGAKRLALISRSGLPPRQTWDACLSDGSADIQERIRAVRELEQMGAQVLIAKADVGDQVQMENAIEQILGTLGRIRGVIHAAGITGATGSRSIQELTRGDCERQFGAKIQGAMILEQVLRGAEVDFCVMFSSLASVLGGLGFCAYSAANACMNAWVHARNRAPRMPWITVNWDGLGDAHRMPADGTLGITTNQGMEALERILNRRLQEVFVTPSDFRLRLRRATTLHSVESAVQAVHSHSRLEAMTVQDDDDIDAVAKAIAEIWIELLGIKDINLDDNFFNLGGDSLLATRIVSRIRQRFRVELPLRQAFETPTIGGLAQAIQTLRCKSNGANVPPLQSAPRDIELPLSLAQMRLWFLYQLDPHSPSYNVPMALRLTGPLQLALFERSIAEIVHRHEALRTCFRNGQGEPVLAIAASVTLPLPRVDLTPLSGEQRDPEAKRLIVKEGRRPFLLETEPGFRASLLRLDDKDHIALFTMHHIISDDWSVNLLTRELAHIYSSLVQDQPFLLPELPLQYSDYAYWQRQWLETEVLGEQITYWQNQLSNLPQLNLPTDYSRETALSFEGVEESFILPAHVRESLKQLARHSAATLFMVVVSGLSILLHALTGEPEVVIGTDIANRRSPLAEAMIGFFVNQLVLRITFSGDPSLLQILQRVRDVSTMAYANQDIPFDRVVKAVQPLRSLYRNPLFEVTCSFKTPSEPVWAPTGLTVTALDSEHKPAAFDLTLISWETEQDLRGAIRYRRDLFRKATISGWLEDLSYIWNCFAEEPDRSVRNVVAALVQQQLHRQHERLGEFRARSRKALREATPTPVIVPGTQT